MVQSFDWIVKASKEPDLKKTVVCCMETGNHSIAIDRFLITFSKDSAKATVRKKAENVPMASKIIPVEIPYCILRKMLEGNWDECRGIRYLDE